MHLFWFSTVHCTVYTVQPVLLTNLLPAYIKRGLCIVKYFKQQISETKKLPLELLEKEKNYHLTGISKI